MKCLAILCLFMVNSYAATYFIKNGGDNSKNGKSMQNAWSNLSSNINVILPGDTILFQSGQTFNDNIIFNSSHNGNASNFITITTTGAGVATINAGNSFGIKVQNAGGFEINNLHIRGNGALNNSDNGIYFEANDSQVHDYIRILNCKVWNFGASGVILGVTGGNNSTRYEDVRVTNTTSHNNREAGIQTFGKKGPNYAVRNFEVQFCSAYRNYGDSNNTSRNTGNGIVLGSVRNGFIKNSIAYENGKDNGDVNEGPVGIWVYEARDAEISFNESYNNRAGGQADGGGFDIDGGTINCVMQYNYSYNNEGAGYLLAQYPGASPMSNLTIRYNISQDDGRKNNYGGISVFATNSSGGIQGANIYNNTVYVSGQSGNNPKGVRIFSGNIDNINFFNNNIVTTGGEDLLDVNSNATDNVVFLGNNYWSSGSNFRINWGGAVSSNYNSWQVNTGQEKINNINQGLNANPTFGSEFRLSSSSPLVNKGLDINALYNIPMGSRHFYGNGIPKQGAYDIGAHESNFTSSCGPVAISNAGFDNGNLNGWSTWPANSPSDDAQSGGVDGTPFRLIHYNNSNFEVFTYRTISNLSNGNYTLKAKAARSSNVNYSGMEVSNYGGPKKTVAVPNNTNWQNIEISNINVSNGSCQIGLYTDGQAGAWTIFDSVVLIKDGCTQNMSRMGNSNDKTEKIKLNNELTVFPNPTHSRITIANVDTEKDNRYSIRDISGREVLWGTFSDHIDVSTLSNGVFILEIKTDTQSLIKKIIKN